MPCPPVTLLNVAVEVWDPAFICVVLVKISASPFTPVALAVGPWDFPLYVNVVVLHVTEILFALIDQEIFLAAVVPSLHCVFVVSLNVAVAV